MFNLIFIFQASFASLNSKLHGYSGFDSSLCYGDILLSYGWISSDRSRRNINNDINKREMETIKNIPIVSSEVVDKKHHDFIRTHFHRATHCDFCSKKVRKFRIEKNRSNYDRNIEDIINKII